MSKSMLNISRKEKITTLTLNRPEKCNALSEDLVQQLRDAFFAVSRDEQTQLVLLNGAGDHFCAGADIDGMCRLAQSSFELGRDDARNLASLLYQMYSFPKPIVTLAQGSTMGGGLGLLACSDLIIAASDARFCFSEVKIGLVPAVVSPYIISLIGQHAARYYFLTAESFTAQEALRLGLVHKLVPRESLEQAGLRLCQILLQHSPLALMEVKRLMTMVINQEISLELSEKTAEILARIRLTAEGQEGLKAFVEKRPPAWSKSE